MDSPHQVIVNAFNLLWDKGRIHTQVEFVEKIGKPQPHVNAALNGDLKRCGKTMRMAIADAFPDDINREYMLTGEGSVERTITQGIPHFKNVTVAAGYFDGFDTPDDAVEIRDHVPGITDAEFSIDVEGDSMYPEIQEGDTLYLRRHIDRDNLPLNKICVIDSEEGGGVVKQLADADTEFFYLHSLNPEYRDYSIHRNDVRYLYRVVGITRKY